MSLLLFDLLVLVSWWAREEGVYPEREEENLDHEKWDRGVVSEALCVKSAMCQRGLDADDIAYSLMAKAAKLLRRIVAVCYRNIIPAAGPSLQGVLVW